MIPLLGSLRIFSHFSTQKVWKCVFPSIDCFCQSIRSCRKSKTVSHSFSSLSSIIFLFHMMSIFPSSFPYKPLVNALFSIDWENSCDIWHLASFLASFHNTNCRYRIHNWSQSNNEIFQLKYTHKDCKWSQRSMLPVFWYTYVPFDIPFCHKEVFYSLRSTILSISYIEIHKGSPLYIMYIIFVSMIFSIGKIFQADVPFCIGNSSCSQSEADPLIRSKYIFDYGSRTIWWIW